MPYGRKVRDNMEKRIKDLFEYQKFENNSRLAKLISETENRYASELSDDDLFFVNAAGEFDISGKKAGMNEDGSEQLKGQDK